MLRSGQIALRRRIRALALVHLPTIVRNWSSENLLKRASRELLETPKSKDPPTKYVCADC